ncbi:MAG: hypothetical protein IKT28_03850 [Rikenellaceae bacterium]|nr:hypothetical protein [Rikenellaceae bacterium]
MVVEDPELKEYRTEPYAHALARWLLEHYVRARFRLEGTEFIPEARQIIHNFLPDIDSYGIATLAEIYDGDAPHLQRGAISQAWSVAAILEIQRMIENNQR